MVTPVRDGNCGGQEEQLAKIRRHGNETTRYDIWSWCWTLALRRRHRLGFFQLACPAACHRGNRHDTLLHNSCISHQKARGRGYASHRLIVDPFLYGVEFVFTAVLVTICLQSDARSGRLLAWRDHHGIACYRRLSRKCCLLSPHRIASGDDRHHDVTTKILALLAVERYTHRQLSGSTEQDQHDRRAGFALQDRY